MNPRFRTNLRVEPFDEEVLVLDGASGVVHRLRGEAARAARHLLYPDTGPTDSAGMAALAAAGLLEDVSPGGGMERRRVLQLAGGAAGGLVATIVLPPAAAASSVGPTSSLPPGAYRVGDDQYSDDGRLVMFLGDYFGDAGLFVGILFTNPVSVVYSWGGGTDTGEAVDVTGGLFFIPGAPANTPITISVADGGVAPPEVLVVEYVW